MKEEVDELTDYAVTVRYPDDFYIPTLTEAKEAFEMAKKIKNHVSNKIEIPDDTTESSSGEVPDTSASKGDEQEEGAS